LSIIAVVYGIFVISAMFDGRAWAKYAEYARWIMMPIIFSNAFVVMAATGIVSAGVVTVAFTESKIKKN
jgi:hypothetical protein